VPATEAAPDLTVVVPVFRNATKIHELAARLERALGSRTYELLLVDDASPDGARTIIRKLAVEAPRVCGIVLAENVGQNMAVLAGLAHARGGAVAVMDADLQDPPEAVPVLLAELERNGAGAVFAARRGRYEPPFRLATGRLLKRALWVLTLGRVPADAGLFVVLRKDVVEQVVACAGSDPYVLVLIARAATSVATVPIERKRGFGSSYTGAMRLRVARRALAAALRLDSGQPRYRVAERIGERFSAEPPT
jgi:polyisoprenyl-phosphate glycosyltransferase